MIEQEIEGENPIKQERFCSYCGLSLVPLIGIDLYVSRNCIDCNKTIYTRPVTAENGQDLFIKAGESAHFLIDEPFSLSPRKKGSLTRSGLLGTVRILLAKGEPKSEDELEILLKFYKDKAESFLKNSSLLDGLDWDDKSNTDEVLTRLNQDKDRREFFALTLLSFSYAAEQAIGEKNVGQTAWAMYHATLSHCFFEMGDFDFEETLWQGHQAHIFLTKVQDASGQTPAQTQAIEKLTPFFERQSELTLHTWVKDGKSIGERIGISELPEETLRAIAQFYFSQFEKKRQEELQAKEDKRKEEESKRQERDFGIRILIACIGAFIGLVTPTLIALINKFIPAH